MVLSKKQKIERRKTPEGRREEEEEKLRYKYKRVLQKERDDESDEDFLEEVRRGGYNYSP